MKLLIMQFSPQRPVLRHPQSMLLNVRDQVSHPYRNTDKIIPLYIPVF
jgi:hypothetical protein